MSKHEIGDAGSYPSQDVENCLSDVTLWNLQVSLTFFHHRKISVWSDIWKTQEKVIQVGFHLNLLVTPAAGTQHLSYIH